MMIKNMTKEEMVKEIEELRKTGNALLDKNNMLNNELYKLNELKDININLQIENKNLKENETYYKQLSHELQERVDTYEKVFDLLKEKYKC